MHESIVIITIIVVNKVSLTEDVEMLRAAAK